MLSIQKITADVEQGFGNQIPDGEQICIGAYTATCQKRSYDLEHEMVFYTFWLDQPVSDVKLHYRGDMNEVVHRVCLADPDLGEFAHTYPEVHFELPTVEDIFGWDDFFACADEDGEQWPLMKIRRNRLPDCELPDPDKYTATWLLNETDLMVDCHAAIAFSGQLTFEEDGDPCLVRPKFILGLHLDKKEFEDEI